MLWLKAWLETRPRIALVLLMGALLCGIPLLVLMNGPGSDPRGTLRVFLTTLGNSGVLWALTAGVVLAGTGIHTALTRPGACANDGGESIPFTLSLPVTRARLFVVRSIAGMLETVVVLTLFAVGLWFLVPSSVTNAHDALRYLAAIVSWSLAVYAISACLSTFCDEGWRFRGSVIGLVALFILSFNGQLPAHPRLRVLPPFIDIYRQLVAPLITHRLPWATIAVPWILTALFLAAALSIIQRRDY